MNRINVPHGVIVKRRRHKLRAAELIGRLGIEGAATAAAFELWQLVLPALYANRCVQVQCSWNAVAGFRLGVCSRVRSQGRHVLPGYPRNEPE
jgi:hypothetical protein